MSRKSENSTETVSTAWLARKVHALRTTCLLAALWDALVRGGQAAGLVLELGGAKRRSRTEQGPTPPRANLRFFVIFVRCLGLGHLVMARPSASSSDARGAASEAPWSRTKGALKSAGTICAWSSILSLLVTCGLQGFGTPHPGGCADRWSCHCPRLQERVQRCSQLAAASCC